MNGIMNNIIEKPQIWDLHRPPSTSGFTLLEHSSTSSGTVNFQLPEDVIRHLAGRMLNQTNDGAQRLAEVVRDIENEITRRTALRLKG